MEKYELELLDPLFYNSALDAGASGSSTTYPWIGDIALDYAINFSFNIYHTVFKYSSHKPDYSEIRNFNFISTVGLPIGRCQKTRVYDMATSFLSEGYADQQAITKSARSPFRSWIKRQGLSPNNKFYFYIIYNKNMSYRFPEKFTIRLGNMKSTLGFCRRTSVDSKDNVWVNLFTSGIVKGFDKLRAIKTDFVYHYSDRYIIKKNVKPSEIVNYFYGDE